MKLRTPENQNGETLPVSRLDFASGLRFPFTSAESAATPDLPAGVYVLAVTSDAFITAGSAAEAADAPGSIPAFAGSWVTLVIRTGDKISARGMTADGVLYAVPLETA